MKNKKDLVDLPFKIDMDPFISKKKTPLCPVCGGKEWISWEHGQDLTCYIGTSSWEDHHLTLAHNVAKPYGIADVEDFICDPDARAFDFGDETVDECANCGATFTRHGFPNNNDSDDSIDWGY